MNVSVAPAGLAWEQLHRMSAGSAAAELPAGKSPTIVYELMLPALG